MNQNKTANFTVLKTYKIQGGQYNSLITFEVQDGKDIVRIRSYFDAIHQNRYVESFNVKTPEINGGKTMVIYAETWYDINIGRAIYKYMTRNETGNPEFVNHTPFVPVP